MQTVDAFPTLKMKLFTTVESRTRAVSRRKARAERTAQLQRKEGQARTPRPTHRPVSVGGVDCGRVEGLRQRESRHERERERAARWRHNERQDRTGQHRLEDRAQSIEHRAQHPNRPAARRHGSRCARSHGHCRTKAPPCDRSVLTVRTKGRGTVNTRQTAERDRAPTHLLVRPVKDLIVRRRHPCAGATDKRPKQSEPGIAMTEPVGVVGACSEPSCMSHGNSGRTLVCVCACGGGQPCSQCTVG